MIDVRKLQQDVAKKLHLYYQHTRGEYIGGVPVDQLLKRINAFLAAPQTPAGMEFPDILFDGYRVLDALSPQERARTSAENVSDVLDAIVRCMRIDAARKEQGNG